MLFAHRGLSEYAENSWQGFKQSKNIGISSLSAMYNVLKMKNSLFFTIKMLKDY